MLFSRFAWLRRFALLPLLMLSPALALAANMADTDLPGGDYRDFSLISPVPSFCANVCAKDSRCKAWTFSWPGKRGKRAKCFLKEKVTKKSSDTCCISGVKSGFTWPGQTSTPKEDAKPQPPKAEDKPESPRTGPAEPPAKPQQQTPSQTPPEVDKKPLPPVTQPPASQEQTQPENRTQPPAQQDTPPPVQDTGRQPDAMTPPPEAQPDPRKASACARYARDARRASALNRQLSCGYTGGRWNASYEGYYNWCLKNPAAAADANTAARARLIRQCRQQPPPLRNAGNTSDLESCARYARLASALARRALRNRCGFFGRRWTTDESKIFNWCRTATITRRRALLAAHRAALLRCTGDAGAWPPRPPLDGAYNPGRPPNRLPQAHAMYKWTKLRGPGAPWSTPWLPARTGMCVLSHNCDCGASTCGLHPAGQAILYWPNGCASQPWVILCQIRQR